MRSNNFCFYTGFFGQTRKKTWERKSLLAPEKLGMHLRSKFENLKKKENDKEKKHEQRDRTIFKRIIQKFN